MIPYCLIQILNTKLIYDKARERLMTREVAVSHTRVRPGERGGVIGGHHRCGEAGSRSASYLKEIGKTQKEAQNPIDAQV